MESLGDPRLRQLAAGDNTVGNFGNHAFRVWRAWNAGLRAFWLNSLAISPADTFMRRVLPALPTEKRCPLVAVIIPCLNESESIARVVGEAFDGVASAGVVGEVVVTDNGSVDDSVAIAMAAGAKVVVVEHRGYGNALRGGIDVTSAPFLVMGDADGSYDFRELPRFLSRLQGGAELVVGCRFSAGGGSIEDGAMPWIHRRIGNPFFSLAAQWLFGVRFRDVHCGLRALSRQFYVRAQLGSPGMELATEMVIKAAMMDVVTAEVPIVLRRDTRIRQRSHLRTFRDGWRHLRLFVLMFRRRNFFRAEEVGLRRQV